LQYILLRIGRLTTRFSYFDNKKVSKMEARASREALRSRYKIFISMRSRNICRLRSRYRILESIGADIGF
jgi:hypothetical protein